MLGAPRSRSAHARRGAGGAWRLQTPTPAGVAALSVGVGSLAPIADGLRRALCTEYGPWRPTVGQVADKFLACGVPEHGFARIRGDACAHEYLLAFSCKCRCF